MPSEEDAARDSDDFEAEEDVGEDAELRRLRRDVRVAQKLHNRIRERRRRLPSSREVSAALDALESEMSGIMSELSRMRAAVLRRVTATEVRAHAIAILGDGAAEWLSAPNKALSGRTPDQLLSEHGAATVEELLVRIEHGVYD